MLSLLLSHISVLLLQLPLSQLCIFWLKTRDRFFPRAWPKTWQRSDRRCRNRNSRTVLWWRETDTDANKSLFRGSNCFGGAKSSVSQTSILNWCHFSETVLTDCHIFKSVNSSVLLSKLALFPTTRYLFSVHKHNSGPKLWIVQCDKIPLCCGQNSFYFCAKNWCLMLKTLNWLVSN